MTCDRGWWQGESAALKQASEGEVQRIQDTLASTKKELGEKEEELR